MIRDKLSAGFRRLLGRSPQPTTTPPIPRPSPPAGPPGADAQGVVPSIEAPSIEAPSLDAALVQQVIDQQVRPALRADGGDIELVEIRGADVHVRLQGACRGCPGAGMTLKMGVEALLRDEIPGFGRVVDLG